MKLSEKIQEALREQQEINLSDPAVQKRLAAQWGYVPAGAQPKKVHAVVCFYDLHYYVSALFFDPTSAIARCRKEINNSAYPDSWEVVEFEIEDTLDSVQPAPSVPEFCPCCGNIMRACMSCPNENCNAVTVTAEQASKKTA